jgi:hypothetical protein
MPRARPILLATAAAVAAAAISIAVAEYLSRDEVCATDGYGVAAGASIAVLELERLPAITDIALIGAIQEVSPVRLSTPSGDLEIDLRRGPEQMEGVYPYTPVTVRVEEVLGVRPSPRFPSPSDVAPADQIEVTVIGGTYTARLTPEEADALGRDEEADLDAGQEPVKADRLSFNYSLYCEVSLTEGDRVIVFLRYGPLFEGLLRSYSIAGGAAWRLVGDDVWPATGAVGESDVEIARLRTLALALGAQTGAAEEDP